MKIKIQQFLGKTLLSWAIVGQNIGRSLLKLGHEVDFVSTDVVDDTCVPPDLKLFFKKEAAQSYDLTIAYTAMHNFPHYLKEGKKRVGIWNYDAEIPPKNLIKFHSFCDYFCPSSTFSANNLINAGIPKEKTYVVPHGLNPQDFENKEKYPLKTNKKYKVLWDMATPHLRKNIRGTLEILGEAFTNKDDVCLVLKGSLKQGQNKSAFVDIKKELDRVRKKYKNYLEVELISSFLPNIIPLYNSCDIVLMLSNFECFGLPALQGLFANKLVVASRHGGQLEFLNDNNSVLVDCDLIRMPRQYQYWEPNPLSRMASPKIEDGAEKLQKSIKDYDNLMLEKQSYINNAQEEFTWDNAVQKLIKVIE